MRIELYSKRRCPLCEDAREVLERLRATYPFDLVEHHIEDSPDAWIRFRYDVPVVFVDGERFCHHRVDEAAEAELVKRLSPAGTGVAQSRARDA